jgi:hypothetical protein
MHIARRLVLLGGTLVGLALAPPALAATQPAAGSFVEGPETVTSEQQAGGNIIVELTRAVVFTGTYTGVGQADERIVIHSDGSTNVHIRIAFTGLACGEPAQLDFLLAAQGQLDANLQNGTVAGHYTTVDGGQTPSRTIRGNGEINGIAGVGGSYDGQVHCG